MEATAATLERRVRVIPATRKPEELHRDHDGKMRVAAYCRVSTDSEEPLNSYGAQKTYYTQKIQDSPDWEMAGIYADEGISGTSLKKRTQFNKMITACKRGHIDLIITKSLSRFARNTVDCLDTVRLLKANGIGVYFEKENINTLTESSEFLITLFSGFAQAESESLSKNVAWGKQKSAEAGKVTFQYKKMLGYRKGADGQPEIVPEEAEIIRRIYHRYLDGCTLGQIKRELDEDGVPTAQGVERWSPSIIHNILTNEKYIGDALSQKSYSCGFPFVQKRNHGERLQYYTENSHPAIIDRDTFERVQALLQKKAQKEKKRREKSPLALKIVCGNCGTVFQRRSSQNGYVTWVCRTHDRHAADCPVGRIPEAEIHAAFLRMYHRLKSNADIILAPALRQLNTLDTILRQNHPQVLAINRAIAEATEESHKISTLRANGLLDADICAARMNAISARLAQLRGERRRLTENEAIDETMDALRKVEQTLLNGPERLDGFDEELFERLVEKIIAESQNRIRFRLYGGLELTEQWEVAAR